MKEGEAWKLGVSEGKPPTAGPAEGRHSVSGMFSEPHFCAVVLQKKIAL